MPPLDTAAILIPLPAAALARLRSAFKTVHYHPDFTLPAPIRPSVNYIFTSKHVLPAGIRLADLPALQHVQMAVAGADTGIRTCELLQDLQAAHKEGQPGLPTYSSASGTHVLSIPPWVVGMAVVLYQQLQTMILFGRTEKRWAEEKEVDFDKGAYFARTLHGRTVGMLGYGALGRETARLLKAMGMRVIAANTSGKSSSEAEYVVPGTGDLDGSIPETYYSTKDSASFDEFLKQTDVLVCSLPSTAATNNIVNKDKLALLKKDALFINVGRGNIISSDDLLAALDSGHLFGAAIDVTNPEPLPKDHPLWSHPRCVITPHLSGNTEGEMDIATDIAIANAELVRKGERPYNLIDMAKGY